MKKKFNKRLIKLGTGMAVTAFAKKCGVSETAMRKYLSGDSEPTLSRLKSISEACHVTVSWLIGESEDPGKEPSIIDDDPEVAELLEGARRVLKSGNPVAFDALERNIRYFAHAVATEKRLEKIEDELTDIKEAIGAKNKKDAA